MIQITSSIAIDENEIHESFVRAAGPGGQNVNKVATSVELRFDIARSTSLPEEVRQRLITLAGNRVTENGVLVIVARRFRAQGRNRDDATDRLVELIRRAAERPVIRRKTAPTTASKIRRLESKRRESKIKSTRSNIDARDG